MPRQSSREGFARLPDIADLARDWIRQAVDRDHGARIVSVHQSCLLRQRPIPRVHHSTEFPSNVFHDPAHLRWALGRALPSLAGGLRLFQPGHDVFRCQGLAILAAKTIRQRGHDQRRAPVGVIAVRGIDFVQRRQLAQGQPAAFLGRESQMQARVRPELQFAAVAFAFGP
jgi:hypothetical protein